MMCDPFPTDLVSQETEYGDPLSSAPKLPPSSLNWTPWTRMPRALTLALTPVVLETVAPELGEVRVTTRAPAEGAGSGPRLDQAGSTTPLQAPAALSAWTILPGDGELSCSISALPVL